MRTLGDLKTEFLVRMNQATTAAFYTDTSLSTFASNANKWASNLFPWPMVDGRYATTFASLSTSEDGYTTLEYPESFKSDSIRLLTIDGKRFDKKNFYKFQSFLEDQSSDTSNIFTDFGRRVFINPRASGLSGTVVAWGQYNIGTLDATDPTATTIFSDSEEDGNEALLHEMMAYGALREKKIDLYQFHHKTAMELLANVWKRIQGEQAQYQDTDNDGMFKRFDVIGGALRDELFKRDQFT